MKIKFIKNKAFLGVLFLMFSSVFLVSRVFVYDATITHAGLTKLAGELYNQTAQFKLSQQELAWLAQGAVEEDTPPRWMNHFYDPINEIGLGGGLYDSAKIWATDYEKQVGYSRGNQSWQEAIYQYQQGDKEKAFVALGHVLHLIEDMTVPAHTRNDTHVEGDPYEVWTRQNFHSVGAEMIYYNNLNQYFNYLANFSNNNFFSKDTIVKFKKPKIEKLFLKNNCLYTDSKSEKRILCFTFDQLTGQKKYYLDSNVAEDYFSILAPKAVGAGAGVIKLFFEEVKKNQSYDRPFLNISLIGILEQQTVGAVVPLGGKIKDRTSDALKQVVSSAKTLIYDISNLKNVGQFASDLWKVNAALAQDLQDLNSIKSNLALAPLKMADQVGEAISDAYGESQMTSNEVYQLLKQLDSSSGLPSVPVSSPTVKTVAPELAAAPEVELDDIFFLDEATELVFSNNSASSSPVFVSNGGGSFSGNVNAEISLATPNDNEENNFSNTSSTREIISDPATVTSSTLENIEEDDGNTSSTVTSTIDVIPDTVTSSTTSTIDWNIPDLNTSSTTSTNEGEIEVTTSTPTGEENNTTTTPENPLPILATTGLVVINEIAWGGTQAAANDEWLELYNAADFGIDLSGWTLTDGNDLEIIFATSTIIASGQYFLLERTSDNTISTQSADLIYTGSLKDGGEKLILKNSADQVVDEVNCLSKWLAGRNAYDKETMERKNAAVSGNDPLNWQNTPMAVWQGKDASNLPIAGTPGLANSPIIYLTGELDSDKILSSGTYILGSLLVPAGKKLQINEGVTIIGGLAANIKVLGQVMANGSVEKPIIFTAYKDSDVGGNFYKQDANWGYIQILSGGQGEFKNTHFNYGNSKWDNARPKGLLHVDSGSLILKAVIFDKNLNEKPRGDLPLLNSINSILVIEDSQFLDSPKGLVTKGGSLNLSGNTFDGLGLSALEAEDGEVFIIENNTFKNLGWEYLNREYWEMPQPLISPVYFKNFLPEKNKTNVYENNVLNSWEVFGRLGASGKIDTLGESPAIMGTLEIPAGINLEIQAGSLIKMVFGSSLRVFGSLISRGSSDGNQVMFTSIHDDEYGGDLDLGQPREVQTEGNEWSQILIQSGEASILDNTWVRYANGVSATETIGSVFVGGVVGESEGAAAPFAAHNLTIEYSRVPGVALHLKDAYGAVIDGCLLKNYSKRVFDINGYTDGAGIWVDGGNPVISNCVIDTFNFGIRLKSESTPELSNIEYLNVDFPTGP